MFDIVEYDEPPFIVVKDFLPTRVIQQFFAELAMLEPHFGTPKWSETGEEVTGEAHAHTLCNGTDIWLPKQGVNAPVLTRIFSQFIFHQGMLEYFNQCKNNWFVPIPYMKREGRVHIINYTDGGYYNWHRDVEVARDGGNFLVHTTFALSLASESASFEGGDSMFMFRNATRRLPFTNNQLIIFPSHVSHAASEVKMDAGAGFMDGRFNIQFWLTSGLTNWSQ